MESADALMEEKKLMAEAKYRNYMSNIDKALRNFEFSSEWADLISALGKLSKAISSNTQYQVIPRRIKISKRLAQCMHPALPSGVHLKALETYSVIFDKTGPERLATELFIYSAGLFPLLGYAAMNVRPNLLGIYETFFVPLGEKLRPALSGFLSGVLPGYENGLDHFERTNSLLNQVCIAVNPTHFYTVLWECVATNASIRLPAITYLLEHFNKRLTMQEQIFIMGHNRDIMMSGLCACLNDSMILVQRNALEFLLLGFPMHTQYLTEADLIKLVTNGLNTILRRDMSLNRRLYSWLLGTEVAKNSPTTYEAAVPDEATPTAADGESPPKETYFSKHARRILIQSIICTLKFSLESDPVELKPYRIMVSLLDKADIGSAVLDFVLCDIIRTMTLSSGNVEVIKSANVLFATFDPAYIWSFMTSMYEKSCKMTNKPLTSSAAQARKVINTNSRESKDAKFKCEVGSGDPDLVEICFLTEFLLETLSLEMYNETTRIYLPKVFLAITQMLTMHLEKISSEEITASLKLCMKIVSRVQPVITSPIKLPPRLNQGYVSSDERSLKREGPSVAGQLGGVGSTLNSLEKSKSDSKLNQFGTTAIGGTPANSSHSYGEAKDSRMSSRIEPIRRSNSNQHIERKSPKKKAKSYSKLSELDKEICPETGQIIEPHQSSSDVDTPLSIKKIKSKAKTPYMRMRGSPKKSRPKDIRITSPSPTSPTSLPANSPESAGGQPGKLLRAEDETDDLPKSAPPEGKRQMDGSPLNPGEDLDESAAEEFSILEKCIRQYEIFYEVYLSRKVLQVKPARPQSAPADISVVLQQAQKHGGEIGDMHVEEIFTRDYVYEDVSPERLHEIDKLFQTLRVNVISRNTQLHSLLNRSMGGGADSSTTSDSSSEPDEFWMGGGEQTEPNTTQAQQYDEKTKANILALIDLRMSAQLRGAIKLASNLLVEMSTFPNCNKNIILDRSDKEIPSWLKVLCLVAAYTQNDRELQLASITTLFDLISLLKSQIEHTTSPGVTFVVMLPLLKFGHVSYIEHKTRVFQLVTSILWNYLGAPGMDPAPITALLYQLHNCLESGLVERIIGNRMFAPAMHQQFSAAEALVNAHGQQPPPAMGGRSALRNYRHDRASDIQLICVSPLQPVERHVLAELRESEAKSFKKFELLWHLGREKQPSKGFEKTLLKVLDTLALPYYMSVRIFVTKWLQASLLRGDLMRLLKPLYKILLAPNTKRTGIVHLRHKELDQGGNGNGRDLDGGEIALASELDHDVYAISSEYGNVVYHKEAASNKKRSPIRSFPKKIFGVTLSSKNKTSNFVSDKSPVRAMVPGGGDGAEESPIGVIVNPLESAADFDDDPSIGEEKQQGGDDVEAGSEIELRRKSQSPEENREEIDDDDGGEAEALGAPKTEREDEAALGHDYDQDFTDESDSSIFDSESENRETSVEKDDSLTMSSTGNTGFDIKRYVGDCERVTEMLSQHERTKNRKTYRLTREKTPGDSSLASVTDEPSSLVSLPSACSTGATVEVDDAAHPADEYFGANAQGDNVNTIVNELIVEQQQQQHQHGEESAAKTTPAADKKKRKYRRSHSLQKHKFKAGASKTASGDKKRMSCISKTSTDSNNSFAGGRMASDEPTLVITDEEEVFIDSQSITVSVDTISSTINVEDKRRNLSLETSKAAKVKIAAEWELTPEALEKGKQNLQILRQNAAASSGGGNGGGATTSGGVGLDGSKRSSTKSSNSSGGDSRKLQLDRVEFFYNHMLIYMGAYDTKQTLYAFQTLRNIMACDTRTFLCLSITTALTSGSLKQLLIRHRKSIAGKGFGGNITNSEFSQSYRGCMHLEVLVTICLYYARGFFHRDSTDRTNQKSTEDDVLGNCRVQLESVELLTLICTELIDITKGMGKSLACYIADLMVRCKLQKVILHCLNSSVVSFGQQHRGDSLPEQLLNFNYPQDENLHAEALQIQLLRLLMAVIKLEYEVVLLKNESAAGGGVAKDADGGNISPTRLSQLADTETMVKYLPNCLISRQPMFLAAVLGALQDERLRHLHRNWTDVVTSSLNCFASLTNIVISVVHQLCNNIDHIARLPLREQSNFPPDYVVAQLEAITTLCHYCLLDNTQQTTLSHLFNQAYPQTSVASQSSNTGQLLNSIVHSILSSATIAAQSEQQAPRNPQLMDARNAVLSHLSRIVASVAALWDTELGQVRQVKQQLMEFLSPVSLHHGANFLAAVAVTWQERGEQHKRREREKLTQLTIAEQYQRNSTLQACPEQLSLVHLVASIRVMPIDSFVHTLYDVVRSPPPIHRPPAYLTIEVSALELSYFYLKSAPVPQIGDSWCSLLLLLREGLSLTPPAQFALLMLLNEFVQRCPHLPFQDKKDIRDLHDITSRLVDSLSTVAGSCLEQTTWLRRNLAVKEDISPLTPDGSSRDGNLTGVQQYSVQAQSVLAAILANLLDVAYGSQEKDKVVTIVTTLLYNITPYLKNHTTRNVPSFYACSSLLASLSGYQYTRKAWRKDMLDLLLDNAFFQMDFSCLPFWKQIMDSLMTYDNTTFRELMSRVSLTQTGSLNIFGSREQECEQRSMLLKRLAFVIYCSEFDQYNKYMPEIQEQLANSLRLFPMVPIVQAAVFLCFRVLLLRMSPDHVTSLWPIIIAEMVQVFLAMEQDLKLDGDDVSQRSHSGMDSWSSNSSNNGLNSHTQAIHWRAVQLEAAKLLELGCVLPATNIPHFQMYRWAFVGTEFDLHGIAGPVVTNGQSDEPAATSALYVPHVRRIARLMDMKYAVHSPTSNIKRGKHLVLTCQQISSLQELYGFFSTLSVLCPNPKNYADVDKDVSSCLAEIEDVLARDFLEKMSSSTTPR